MNEFVEQTFQFVLNEAKISKEHNTIRWETIEKSYARNLFDRKTQYGILNGNIGILLFLISYYKFSKDKPQVKELVMDDLG
ncbi:hypothetical protein [Flammeovirga aprica]|uniref:Uncharacterized protein n=1 Tax=Flammeovirga aprica JL-4 TaxID=694437 RepID=A0A7X9XD37_9BACT|nr:hypothetical protein [Flammeovirga aprica]NME72388.1 hypothetical protein [Flammeovirga aprica JL-4]